ncbi:hypothetical protein SAY87_018655 [Trapa incisa]|uniref:Uncharacterized protein n=1 Tax=Trapa incisa TaxID=236973 RepID=A0AAN7Q1D2_9MYRT|nr:hypothetical protein SAY87_018655 [Trapa incisa]
MSSCIATHHLPTSAPPARSTYSVSLLTRAPVRLSGFRSSAAPSHAYPFPVNHARSSVIDHFGRPEAVPGQLGFDRFLRFSSPSDAGFDGAGGYGGSGDGSSRGRGGGGDGGTDGESGGDINWSLLSWYLGLLAKYPVRAKAITSALLTFIGDLISQLVFNQVPSPDLKRILSFSFVGLVLVGPSLHFWYLYLSKLVSVPGASGAFMRLLLDQFIFTPVFLVAFLSTLVTLEGKPSQVVPKLQQELFSTLVANWQLWIPFQFLNFRFVPQQFQVLAANILSLVWNVILSSKAHKEIHPK